jgi:hypothetical protein
MQLEYEVNSSPPFCAKVKKAWSYAFFPLVDVDGNPTSSMKACHIWWNPVPVLLNELIC